LSNGFDDIEAGLTAIFDLGKSAGAEASESSEGRLGVPKLYAHQLDSDSHSLARSAGKLSNRIAYPIAQP